MKENKEIKDINFNNSECLISYDLIGTTEYVNLCNNEINTVPWGVGGWFAFIFVGIALLGALVILIAFIKDLFFE